ncbi:MAG: fibronectin type III domain-containing protein, partial [Gammaproteobacteria bacterium]|nr:fibronectin type III domain-containing protein [Gammaproteobacteria bacterium]
PSVNQSFNAGGKIWVYNGNKWVLLGTSLSQTVPDGSITQAKLGTSFSGVTVTTSANRSSAVPSPFTGQLVFLTDTKKVQVWDGSAWLNITLAPPEPPTSLSATALSTTSISVAFTAGGANGSPITNYKYALSTNGGSTYGAFTALDPADALTPITISGLTAGTTYHIKLKAVNDMGDSVESSATSVGTLSTPDAPTGLSASNATLTTVDVSFTAGAQGGSAISNYQYALSTNGGSSYGSFTALNPADATSPITISGLTSNTAYYVKLKAVNNDGAGAESAAVSFTTQTAIDYLVVAGGGASGGNVGGGGGAGGMRCTVTATGGSGSLESALPLTVSTNYTVTVGAGAAGGNDGSGSTGASGSNSVFSTITSTGGGGGAGRTAGAQTTVGNGGSGGGGGGSTSGSATGGTGNSNEGFAGGTGVVGATSNTGGGGGGGASAVGGNAGSGKAGDGGAGRATSITGSSVTYAGGGGGGGLTSSGGSRGFGGAGGGGNGQNGAVGTAGTANTGGGGGGGSDLQAGSAGGSGVVILRYPSIYTITIGAGLTGTTATVGSDKVTTLTAGSGNVSWS